MRTIAIIPARSGSKRLPLKNIREINGKSLLKHAVDVAVESDVFSQIIVSSDSREILDSVCDNQNVVCNLRSANLSADNTKLKTLVRYLVDLYAAKENKFEVVALIIPTSPLRRVEDIRNAAALLRKDFGKLNGIMSISKIPHPPQHALRISKDGFIEPMFSEFMDTQSQFLEESFIHDGTLILVKIDKFIEYGDFYMPNLMPYYVNPERAVDINVELDLQIAEFLMGRGN